MGEDACHILAAALRAVDPYACVQKNINLNKGFIAVGEDTIPQDSFNRIVVIGFGKASVTMAKAAIDILGDKVTYAAVVAKSKGLLSAKGYGNILEVYAGGHPLPTTASIQATDAIISRLPELTSRDLVLVLISGGGSALFTKPISCISLEDLQAMTDVLLKCGASIHEINTLRKHLDEVKGGRLALILHPAQIHTLILSDVIGDRLDMIASGPTVPDPTSYADAIDVVKKYSLVDRLPESIICHLNEGKKGQHRETLKPEAMAKINVKNHLIATNFASAQAACSKAESLGYHSAILSTHLTGDTCCVSAFLKGVIDSEWIHDVPLKKPACLIFGGETTVEVLGDGLGGRNQDLALRMVEKISGKQGLLFIAFATDGEDGPTDAAGAVVDGFILKDSGNEKSLQLASHIKNNDAYPFFDKVGGLIKTGSTGTNVNDLVLILLRDVQRKSK